MTGTRRAAPAIDVAAQKADVPVLQEVRELLVELMGVFGIVLDGLTPLGFTIEDTPQGARVSYGG